MDVSVLNDNFILSSGPLIYTSKMALVVVEWSWLEFG